MADRNNTGEGESNPEPPTKKLNNFFYQLNEVEFFNKTIYFLFIALLIAFSSMSISEIDSRETFSKQVKAKIIGINETIVGLNFESNNQSLDSSADTKNTSAKENLLAQKEKLSRLNEKTLILINSSLTGNSNPEKKLTLDSLTRQYQDIINDINNDYPSESELSYLNKYFYSIQTDYLLVIAMILCCALGSFIASSRKNQGAKFHSAVTSFGTGFLVYLVIKGGQQLLIINLSEARYIGNPYSSALIAFLTGMFSDKAYGILTAIIEKYAKENNNSANKLNDIDYEKLNAMIEKYDKENNNREINNPTDKSQKNNKK